MKELVQLYISSVDGNDPALSPLSLQFRDFAAWSNEQLAGISADAHKRYWLEKFNDDVSIIDLPTDFKRPSLKTYSGRTWQLKIPSKEFSLVKSISSKNGITNFVFFKTIVNLLLHKYSGQNDIVVGTVISNRVHPDMENQMGFYVSTVPIRTSFLGEQTFYDLLMQIKNQVYEVYKHQVYPLDKIIDDLKLPRDPSRTPLFDVLFVYENDGIVDYEIPKLKITEHECDLEVSKFDLTFIFQEIGDAVNCSINYNSDIYASQRIERMGMHFLSLLNTIIKDVNIKVKDVEYLLDGEKSKILKEFNCTASPSPQEKTIIEIFEEKVLAVPDSIALVSGEETYTYSQLNTQANRLANYLLSRHDIIHDDIIAVMSDRSEKAIISILAILKTGAAYLPVDSTYPTDRIKYILNDAKIKCVLCVESKILDRIGSIEMQLENLSLVWPCLSSYDHGNLDVNATSSDLAYVIYTSGSTGQPKGVMIENRSVINMAIDQIRRFEIVPEDRVVQVASLSFDASIYEILIALLSGASLALVEEKTIKDPELFFIHLREKKVTVAVLLPSYLRSLPIEKLSFLRIVCTAAEPPIMDDAINCLRNADYYNCYGPTECSVCVSNYKVGQETIKLDVIPIGKPISNVSIYILDQYLKPVPVGHIGEICVGGDCLARGYIGQSDVHNSRFTEDPFKPFSKIYLTGDLGKHTPNGDVIFLGRKDTQVKIRGFRIELAEIEIALLKHPRITQAVVVMSSGNNNAKHLVAYFGSRDRVTIDEIKNHLINLLPNYMIPTFIIQLEDFPMTTTGKVDRKKLPNTVNSYRSVAQEILTPENETQKQLLDIWRRVLGVEEISTVDNFFEIGGDSLKVISLHEQINSLFPGRISITDLFVYNSIVSLGVFLRANTQEVEKDIEL